MEKKVPEAQDEAGEAEVPNPAPKRRARKRRGLGFAGFFSLLVACFVFFVLALALSGRTIAVPELARAKLEEKGRDAICQERVKESKRKE